MEGDGDGKEATDVLWELDGGEEVFGEEGSDEDGGTDWDSERNSDWDD